MTRTCVLAGSAVAPEVAAIATTSKQRVSTASFFKAINTDPTPRDWLESVLYRCFSRSALRAGKSRTTSF